ncbi:type II toxin-antitoxin system RelE/ParE family toxin [Proteiniphilum sp. X52]|uniref:type II toxin-antitoxin system RelE/ParE family toxin n=1 Tax=Proteiniphilum sp. X52 TaxID=2382159 RepID=UPI000F09DE5F|nr:type II toxin-antitoxin system RelE/ParE family toxin [Proteiniphilum sp. X52]RNC66944.1 type II toxin-antitoxin system RelE/ParE family toxin [Proteiniphilum sp. X52]
MVKRTIIWSKQADYELKNTLIFHNLRNGNTKYSLRLLDQIKQIMDALSENEFIGRLSEDKRTRVIVMKVYLIFYEIIESEIHILSFWDNRQNPENRIDKKNATK